MLELDSDVQFIKGVGPKRASLLGARGIRKVEDLLLHFPRCYQDRAHFVSLDSLRTGESYTIRARVYSSRLIRTRSRRSILDVVLTDGTSFVHAKWFNGDRLHRDRVFVDGTTAILFGRSESDKYDQGMVFFNPEFEVVPDGEERPQEEMGGYVGIYEEVSGITSRQLRVIVSSALDRLPGQLHDPLPEQVRSRFGFPDLMSSFEGIHRPTPADDIEQLNARRSPAHRRFIFEEFFLVELTLALRRFQMRGTDGVRFRTNRDIRERLKEILPFHPTGGQKRAFKEIVDDLKAAYPMSRLLQGDVGCGKTIVAFEAIVVAVENGYQAAMMAPTEILAEQHYLNARRVLEPLGYSVGLIKRTGRKSERGELLARIRSGDVQVVIGTHALLVDDAGFGNLGLVVIDEQHRFGVMQRLRLMEKGRRPNTLVMTATPIPRTLAMTFFGDLDISVIDEMPPGRTPIATTHVTDRSRDRVYARVAGEVEAGRQCYVVYPLIEESEKLDLRSATDGYERLRSVFSGAAVGLLHGRMKSDEKEATMSAFTAGEIDVLVCTTVVEVGVDVSNATLMLIEHAERFGIAQLHQLRGRVGRGRHTSSCFLMTPNGINDTAYKRVRAVASSSDGFRLAEIDLQLRGPGELAGTRQSGVPEFKVASLIDDTELLVQARDEAERWMEDAPARDRLIQELSRRGPAGLATVG
jgi:ATP-dependent DNA helicase RecG